MDSKELRQKFINFFVERGHKHLTPSGLIPKDESVLFTTAGMQPLIPYLMGEKHPEGNKLVNIQRCIRTDDIAEVGDESHLTFFEMLGYWSLGAYWKKEAINYTYEFFTKELGFDPKKFGVTCFEGDPKNNIPKDTESAQVWRVLGINRITFLDYKDNFWGPTSVEGPCGPDTEIFMWSSKEEVPEDIDINDKKWVEIGNDVFMQYYKKKTADGFSYELLSQKNVDFGAGFERVAAFIENKNNIYETEFFQPLIKEIKNISGKNYEDYKKEFRVIADHIKAATFAINDNILPSNKERGYIVRRLIRRAIVKATKLGIENNFTAEIASVVFKIYDGVYSYKKDEIISALNIEEEKFRQTLRQGLKIVHLKKEISGRDLFDLYQSSGIPADIAEEEAKAAQIKIKENALQEYQELFKKHQDLSRAASAGMFRGGLASGGKIETKYHTATHLLLAALREILGPDINQKGANITAERIRFDFNYPEKLSEQQIDKIEDWVNDKIKQDLSVTMEEMPLKKALSEGATSIPGFNYLENVKVFSIGTVSREICGGPHAQSTGELGHFKITKEESSSAGIRRLKAVLE